MHQVTCGCGCNNVIPDVVMLTLDSRFGYGRGRPGVGDVPEQVGGQRVCQHVLSASRGAFEYRRAA
jgi:hypothetical protein